MSKFRIGQKVRVRYAMSMIGKRFVGKEGIITEIQHVTVSRFQGDPVIYGLDICGIVRTRMTDYGWSDSQLEPILYDGNQTVEWSECLWQPSGEHA